MSEFYAIRVPYSLTSTNTANSFDFVDVVDQDEPQLLCVSLSMESLSSLDSDDAVPPFPADRPFVCVTVELMDDLTQGLDGSINWRTTIATPPRMRHVIPDPLKIEKWLGMETMWVRPPGHLPWAPPPHAKELPWVPSGSVFPPAHFKRELRIARNSRRSYFPIATFGSVKPRTNGRRPDDQQGEFRKALIFEREITLETHGETKRWSIQVPAASMKPEMVDMMLELQDLNSFFKTSLEGLEESVAVLTKEKEKLQSPTQPIPQDSISPSSQSSTPTQEGPPVTLAVRRGRSLLPPLSLAEGVINDSYPSIPTAFLGTPSAYSPKFGSDDTQDAPSLNLTEMITNLRLRCEFPQNEDSMDSGSAADSPLSMMSFAAPSDRTTGTDDDDWAFAVSFLDEHDGPPSNLAKASKQEQQVADEKTPRFQSRVYGPPLSPAPTAPLPVTPILKVATPISPPLLSSSHREVRGILKSCKNVRFASLPEKHDDKCEPEVLLSAPPANSHSTIPPPQRPSRVLSYTRSSKQGKENIAVQTVSQQGGLPPSHILGMKVEKVTNARGSPSPSAPGDPLQVKKSGFPIQNRSPPRIRHSSAVPARQAAPTSSGRQPFRPHSSMVDSSNEISPRTKAGSRWTMNDITFKRGSSGSPPEGTPKSRMPVPLRNILTRFK